MRRPGTLRAWRRKRIVPIVEPEVLMDGDNDIGACAAVTEWVLKEFPAALLRQRATRRHRAETDMIVPGMKSSKQSAWRMSPTARCRS